ncbi:hypothetical protein AGDE_08766 [Angomonas deanei]|nr:hypothetical protein AGDE_08766 [Angomonas deanei]|eukprot:EPY32291.1 hypothetical protein AGDE_08766 [Angomonas deanei]
MKKDQREADTELGLKRGQVNKNFSSWVVVRGLKTQPMLACGCLALALTTSFKIVKYCLASQRCYEFYLDDLAFNEMEEERMINPQLAKEIAKLTDEKTPLPQQQEGSLAGVVAQAKRMKPLALRRPTYMDGVAVGLAGSILDCWVPQKPLHRYFNMCAGF